jgi:heme exporter protein B
MTDFTRGWRAVLWKELALEWKTRETAGSMVVFSLLVLVMFHFAFESRLPADVEAMVRKALPEEKLEGLSTDLFYRLRGTEADVGRILPGVYWVAVTFAAVLGLNRSYARDAEGRVIEGQLVAPVSPAAVYLGKATANSLFIVVTGAILLPFVAVLYNESLAGIWPRLLVILAVGGTGTGLIGTLFSSVAGSTRLREIMLPILLLPVLAPMLIWAIQATSNAFLGEAGADFWNPILLMAGQGAIFLVASLLLYEYLVEE